MVLMGLLFPNRIVDDSYFIGSSHSHLDNKVFLTMLYSRIHLDWCDNH